MIGRRIIGIGACVVGVLALTACEQTKQALGRTKNPPDEFAVYTRAPLSLPPDYQLRPPAPGSDRPQAVNPRDRALQAVTGRDGDRRDQPAAGAASGASAGEMAILKATSALQVDPNIRREVNQETFAMSEGQRTLTEKLLFWQDPIPTGIAVDPTKESRRLREAQALGNPLNDGEVPVIERKRKGILEGIFK